MKAGNGSYLRAAAHPRVMSQVKPGMWAGALTHKHTPSVHTYAGQKILPLSIGQYTLRFILSNSSIDATVDTGSAAPQIACLNITGPPNVNLTRFQPAQAVPRLKLIDTNSTACQKFSSEQIITKPGQPCQYYTGYAGNDWIIAQVLEGELSLPGSALPAVPFSFGCALEQSTDPYFFFSRSALMGMDWEPASMWSQLMAAKLVSDTMYICMGNGGYPRTAAASGVIILGSDDMVALPKGYATSVVTIKLLNPYTTPSSYESTINITNSDNTTTAVHTIKTTIGLGPPSMWVRLTGFSIGANPDKSFHGSARLMAAPKTVLTYLIDSGTSQLLLTRHEYAFWLDTFFDALSFSKHYRGGGKNAYNGFDVVLDKVYTSSQLDVLMPPLVFDFEGSSGPVNILPSQYMLFNFNTTSNATYYISIAARESATEGILGNAWMNGWLIQQTRSTLALKMTRVKACDDIIY